tara:strand:+ start:1534 stop:1854 length:321 start_codon:yes stop_codon:yes gene_type:complete
MSKTIRELKEDLISAGKTAAGELVKVAKKTLTTEYKEDDELSLDKLKNAASAKKMAIFDAFEILARVELEQKNLDEEDKTPKNKNGDKVVLEEKPLDFRSAEERTG